MRCKICQIKFKQLYIGQHYCSFACKNKAPKEIPVKKTVIRKVKSIKKVAKIKESIDYEKLLQVEINTLIKRIDYGHACISCAKFTELQAGHYHSVGSNPQLRYNLFNIFGQCQECNINKSGSPVAMRLGVLGRFSQEFYDKVQELTLIQSDKKTKEEIKKAVYLIRAILRNLAEKPRNNKEREQLRINYQEKLWKSTSLESI